MERLFEQSIKRGIAESNNLKRIMPEKEIRNVIAFLDSKLHSDLCRTVTGIPPKWNR